MVPSTTAARPDQTRPVPVPVTAPAIPLLLTVRDEQGSSGIHHATFSASSAYACHILPESLSDAIYYAIDASNTRSNCRVGFVTRSDSDGH